MASTTRTSANGMGKLHSNGSEITDGGSQLGRSVAFRRLQLGMSQEELAAKTFTSPSLIARIEQGHPPSPAQLRRLLEVLSMDPEPGLLEALRARAGAAAGSLRVRGGAAAGRARSAGQPRGQRAPPRGQRALPRALSERTPAPSGAVFGRPFRRDAGAGCCSPIAVLVPLLILLGSRAFGTSDAGPVPELLPAAAFSGVPVAVKDANKSVLEAQARARAVAERKAAERKAAAAERKREAAAAAAPVDTSDEETVSEAPYVPAPAPAPPPRRAAAAVRVPPRPRPTSSTESATGLTRGRVGSRAPLMVDGAVLELAHGSKLLSIRGSVHRHADRDRSGATAVDAAGGLRFDLHAHIDCHAGGRGGPDRAQEPERRRHRPAPRGRHGQARACRRSRMRSRI